MEPPSEFGSSYSGFYETKYAEDPKSRRRSGSQSQEPSGSQQQNFQNNLTKMVWEAGSQQVKQAFSWYGNIDLFRPYFDVDPKQVRNRLFQSLIPRRPSRIVTQGDLYGPLMLIFTLCALLLFSMKSSGYIAKDGTLIGTAFVTCFGYWFFTSLTVYTMSYIFSVDVPMLQVFSMLGYAMFGHCIVVALTAVLHTDHDHLFFYGLLAIFGGLSTVRMAIYFAYKTPDRAHKMILPCVIAALHLGFLMYLHFGFHYMVEEVGTILGEESFSNTQQAQPLHQNL